MLKIEIVLQINSDYFFVIFEQTAVQVYRSMNMRKTRYDLPEGEEYEQWKKQLPQWLETQKLEIPDIVKDQQNKINTEE